MNIVVDREIRSMSSTIGKMYVDSAFECFTLEDYDRSLASDMKLEAIKAKKIKGKTAIPTGTYDVIINRSNRFKRRLPLLLNVPGYEGVRIHPGNTAADTEGCILVGVYRTVDLVGNSRMAFNKLFEKMEAAVAAGDKITITIK